MELREQIIIEHLEQTASTNDWLRLSGDIPAGCLFHVAVTEWQSAGRGQKGNSWESEKGANLLFSIRSVPGFVEASAQFCLSQAIALAVTDAVAPFLGNEACHLSVKWPNDIYWKDLKLGGILIENRLQGSRLADSIIGVGLNINQKTFLSDAPNPVSIANITGIDSDRDAILGSILTRLTAYYLRLQSQGSSTLHEAYMSRLFHRTGYHTYSDNTGEFQACIHDVLPSGILILEDTGHNLRPYEFKQVKFILK